MGGNWARRGLPVVPAIGGIALVLFGCGAQDGGGALFGYPDSRPTRPGRGSPELNHASPPSKEQTFADLNPIEVQVLHAARRKKLIGRTKDRYVNGFVRYRERTTSQVYPNRYLYRGVFIELINARFRSFFHNFNNAQISCHKAVVIYAQSEEGKGKVIQAIMARGEVVYSDDQGQFIRHNQLDIDFPSGAFLSGGRIRFQVDPPMPVPWRRPDR